MWQRLWVALSRILRNFRSNRWWIFWGGRLYIRSERIAIEAIRNAPDDLIGWVARSAKYIELSNVLRRSAIPASDASIFITELGMFGNMCRRLGNGLSIGLAMQFAATIVPREVIFHTGIFAQAKRDSYTEDFLWFGIAPNRSQNRIKMLITGDFFGSRHLKALDYQHSIDKAWEILHRSIRDSQGELRIEPTELAIHVRGGDVFGPRRPANYGQPPLAYYEYVLRWKAWKSVVLVHQDKKNPVLPGLVQLCRDLDIDLRCQSGSISEDINALLDAKTIVAGRGTFVPAVANLSRHCTRVFYFEDKCNLVPRRSGIETIRILDKDGEYKQAILSSNWRNSDEQRAMMMSYPLSSITSEHIPRGKR